MENLNNKIEELFEKMDARNEIRFQDLKDHLVRISLDRMDYECKIKALHEDVVASKMCIKELQKAVGQK